MNCSSSWRNFECNHSWLGFLFYIFSALFERAAPPSHSGLFVFASLYASALLGDSDLSRQWTSREPLSIDLYSRAGKSGFALCFGSAMLSPLCNLCGALNPITSADWLYLTPDNGINEFKDPPPLPTPKADKNGVICMQVTCSKRGKVRWIKMQLISFPVLWPNYVASFFHASKSHRIGLDGKAADSPLLCPDLN